MAQQKVTIKIPKGYGPIEREAIAEDIIDRIIKRTQSGKDVSGEKFPGYSKSYKKSLNFKIAGKSSKVNLTLTEEMLNSIEILNSRSGSVTVGIPADDTRNNGKAEGNQKGTYGKKTPNPRKARKFLGLSDDELDKILKKYPQDKEGLLDIAKKRAAEAVAARRAAKEAAEEFADEIS